jgi:hypothetical protein
MLPSQWPFMLETSCYNKKYKFIVALTDVLINQSFEITMGCITLKYAVYIYKNKQQQCFRTALTSFSL